jgi:hypothetical protein
MNTVKSSKLMTVKSLPPHLLSALAYFPPQRAHRRGTVRCPVDILSVAHEEDIARQVFGSEYAGLGKGAAAKEALPEVTALEDEMDQGVGGMPDEEEARLVGCRSREEQA